VADIQLRPTPIATARGPEPAPLGANSSLPNAASGLGVQLEDMEREAIVKALEQTRFNKTAAAKVLGMSFRALRYRIKKLGIE
jgi:two-component system response regulator PilR (NtrC family)